MRLTQPNHLFRRAEALNLIWATLCLLTVLAGLAVGRERRQVRDRARIGAERVCKEAPRVTPRCEAKMRRKV
jgi:hypothetical protein